MAFICKEQLGRVRGRMAKRDDIFSDDLVAVYLDTCHDRQHALSFYVNPLGIQSDSVYTGGQTEGYTDRRENLALVPGPIASSRRLDLPGTVAARQVFVKWSCLLRP